MPMNTTFVISGTSSLLAAPPAINSEFSARITRRMCSTCATISPGLSWRRNPCWPVAQKVQPRAHPACVEMHTVRRARL